RRPARTRYRARPLPDRQWLPCDPYSRCRHPSRRGWCGRRDRCAGGEPPPPSCGRFPSPCRGGFMTDFLLELRSEEIPARMQDKARDDLARLFAAELAKAGLAAGKVETYATPRRLPLIARDPSASTESLRWVRPLHGIVALLGSQVVPCEIAGIVSGRSTVGHRFHSAGTIEILSPADYAEQLRTAHVVLDQDERRALIRTRAAA